VDEQPKRVERSAATFQVALPQANEHVNLTYYGGSYLLTLGQVSL
jgi:hypothetical protein